MICGQCRIYKQQIKHWQDLALKYGTSLKNQQALLDQIESERKMNEILTKENLELQEYKFMYESLTH